MLCLSLFLSLSLFSSSSRQGVGVERGAAQGRAPAAAGGVKTSPKYLVLVDAGAVRGRHDDAPAGQRLRLVLEAAALGRALRPLAKLALEAPGRYG